MIKTITFIKGHMYIVSYLYLDELIYIEVAKMAYDDGRKMGDRSIEEACNDGDRDLMADYVGDTKGDMVTHFKQSHAHMSLYFNRNPPANSAFALDKPHNPMRFAEITQVEKPVAPMHDMPDECVTGLIPGWQYHPEFTGESDKRRVFRRADQGLELDIDETLRYMSANSPGKAEIVRPLLEWENSYDNAPNQVLLQRMYVNIEADRPMFDGIGMLPDRFRAR